MCSNLHGWPIFNSLKPKFISEIHMVLVYGKLGKEALIVTKDKMVYAMTNNVSGCLGTEDKNTTLQPKKIEALCKNNIKTFVYGNGPLFVLLEEGQVYSLGHDSYQLGNKEYDQILTPTLMNMPTVQDSQDVKRIVDIACGNYHSVFLTEHGEVYAWESKYDGSMMSNYTYLIAPKLVLSEVVCISCGEDFSMAITKEGNVYSWGINTVGQLGKDTYKNTAIIEEDNVYGFGINKVTKLGKDTYKNTFATPELVSLPKNLVVVKVVCGLQHTLALTDEGKIYAWGGNNFGQLGIGNKTSSWKPVMVKHQMENMKWIDIAALCSNNISVAVTEEGYVNIWGDCRGETILTPTATLFSNVHNALAYYGPSVMHEPLILDEDMGILGCLEIAFDNPSTSDLKIQIKDQYIHVHKAILKIRSLHFKTKHDWTEDNQNVIKNNQFSYVVYKAYLKYLYTNKIDLPFKEISELFDLADTYGEENLKKQCIHIIKQGITISDVAFFYAIAVKYGTKELEEFCIKFAAKNMMAMIQTEHFANLNQNLMKMLIINAGKAGCFKS